MSSSFNNLFSNGAYEVEGDFKKTSPQTVVVDQVDDLADVSTHLYHTNELAHGAIEVATVNVVRTGLKLQSNINREILGLSEDQAQKHQDKIELLFNMYANTTNIDIQGEKNFKQLQQVVHRTKNLAGGCIILYPEDKEDNLWGQKVKLLEPHHLKNRNNIQDTNLLSGGVEEDALGRVVKYHLLKVHPNNTRVYKIDEWVVVPTYSGIKKNITHYYDQKRAGQKRGIPYLSPVLDIFRKIKDFTEAELDAAILNARFAGFVFNENPPTVNYDGDDASEEKAPPMQIKKGNLIKLEQGWKINFADPARPNKNAKEFTESQIQLICVALQIPFEQFMKLFKASYSASRGAIIEGMKYFDSETHDLTSCFCQPTFENFLLFMVRKGHLVLDGFLTDELKRAAWCGSEWVSDGTPPLNPVHTAKSTELNLALALTTRDREAKKLNGSAFKKNVETAKEETRLIENSGMPYIGKAEKTKGAND